MPLIDGDDALIARHLGKSRARLEAVRRLLTHCPCTDDCPQWVPAEIDRAIADTLITYEYLERCILR